MGERLEQGRGGAAARDIGISPPVAGGVFRGFRDRSNESDGEPRLDRMGRAAERRVVRRKSGIVLGFLAYRRRRGPQESRCLGGCAGVGTRAPKLIDGGFPPEFRVNVAALA